MLENSYKKGTQFLSDLLNSLVSLLKILIQSRFGATLPVRQRPICSVLGNGPSLNDSLTLHSDFITDSEVVCVNNFASSSAFSALRPQNYVLLDPAYFQYTRQTTNRTDIEQMFTALVQTTTWDIFVYMPQYARPSYLVQTIFSQNTHLKPVFFNYTIVRGFDWLTHWLFSRQLGMPQSQTVLTAALFLAINRRFSTVYLFGADQSWHEGIRISDTNQLLMQQTHFYDTQNTLAYVPVGGAGAATTSRMATQFASLAKVFFGYEVLKKYADYLGVQVLNASSKSYIDAFNRVVVRQSDSITN